VHSEGSVGVGASVNGVIVIIILGDCDPLGSGELLFQVTGDGLLRLPSEGGGALVHPCLIQGLACDSHGGDESLLLSVRGSGDGGHGDNDLFLIDGEVRVATQHGQQDGGG
jgi:hypothetical protein